MINGGFMNTFTALSGARIGASCYLLEAGGCRILLDCGSKVGSSYTDYVDIPDPETIDAIFVSHAHLDHMGGLAYASAVCSNAKIYMTDVTKEFVQYQLTATVGEYIGANTDELRFHNRIHCKHIMNRVTVVDYYSAQGRINSLSKNASRARGGNIYTCETASGNKFQFVFFPSGHIPGGAMIYLNVGGKSILYTGDFASYYTYLTCPYSLPDNLTVDVLILCGTHANKPGYELISDNPLSEIETRFYSAASRCDRIVIPVSQLTKGLEIIAMLSQKIESGVFPRHNIYLDSNLWELAKYYEYYSETFRLPSYIKRLEKSPSESEKVIVFEKNKYDAGRYSGYKKISQEFTLHADYNDIVTLIEILCPKQTYVVHTTKGEDCLCKEDRIPPKARSIVYTEDTVAYNF